MTCDLVALSIAAKDPQRLAGFWGSLLGWERAAHHDLDVVPLLPDDDAGFPLRFVRTQEDKRGSNQAHFDLTSTTPEDQRRTVERALSMGARHFDVGQTGDEGHVVLADPEDNEFCVIEPGNGFLAGCGALGALSCDGTQAVGYFWSEALGWPLVWDQDEETAIQSPHGGPKITWGGPPLNPRWGRRRMHFDLAATGDVADEVDRLLAMGARRLDIGQGDADAEMLADPDGNEFCLLSASAAAARAAST